MTTTRPSHSARWLAGAVLAIAMVVAATVGAGAAAQQEPVPADEAPTTSVRTGPDPTGRSVPPTQQRVIDSAIWVWLLVVVGATVVLVGRVWWRSTGDDAPGFALAPDPGAQWAEDTAPITGEGRPNGPPEPDVEPDVEQDIEADQGSK
ncbi:MAG: hypothetical protein JJU45_04265 [Acidimicrobiia bacterium]|nr:hypothetical protein [Acidimicrobiia bacterium]